MIPGDDHSEDSPSTYDVEELDLSHNPTITADNLSAYHPTDEDLDVKLPATTKVHDVLLEDLVPLQYHHHIQLQIELVLVNNSICHRTSRTFTYSMTTT